MKPSDPRKLWDSHKEQLAADWAKDCTLENAVNKVLLWLKNHLASHEVTLCQLNLPEPIVQEAFFAKVNRARIN